MALTKVTGAGLGTITANADFNGNLDVDGTIEVDDKITIAYEAGSSDWELESTSGDDFTISRNGSQKLLIDGSTSNVGIGTSSPNRMLTLENGDIQIHDSGTGDPLLNFSVGGTQASPTQSWTFRIDNSESDKFQLMDVTDSRIVLTADGDGNVGIGISNPDDKLHVADSSNAELKLQTDNANGGSVVKFNRSGTDNSYIGTKGYFLGNSDNNLYLRANSGLGIQFYTNGNNERMRIDSSGNVGIGTSSPTELLEVHGDTPTIKLRDTSAYSAYTGPVIAFQGRDNNESFTNFAQVSGLSVSSNNGLLKFETRLSGSLNEAMRIDQSGNLMVGRTNNPSGVSNCIYALGNYGVTTSSGANVFINSEGLFFRSTSSQRYKNTINDATHGLTELLTLRPVTYKGNNDGDTVFGGLIAEEVHDAGLTEFVQYNDDGEPDALAYGHMVSLCIKAIQELKAELDSAKARITTLENGD